MTSAVLALLASSLLTSPPVCEQPVDCGEGGVCIMGQCRVGSERATVELLATVAVAPPVVNSDDPILSARAMALQHRVERALDWTGFYVVVPADRHPRVPRVDRMTAPAKQVWLAFGIHRVVRLSVEPGLDPGSIVVDASLVETDGSGSISLSMGPEPIPAGADARVVARWVNALVGRDTGLPGCVGTRLLVSVEVARGNKEVAVVEADGPGLSFVTDNGSLNLAPAWGPNGTIGYMSYLRRNPDWIVNGAPFSTRPGLNAAGDWSNDGRTIALTVTYEGNTEIVLLDAATGAQRSRLTTHASVDTSPAWSPDGKRIAFVSDRTGAPQIWVHDLTQRSTRRLTSTGYMASPVWSPLGDTLVYTRLVGGEAILIRHDLDTGKVQRLTTAGMSADSPTISPDGRYVAFVREVDGYPASLWRIPIRGGEARPLAQHAWPLYAPDWQP